MKRFFTNLMALAVVFSLSTATLNAQKVLSLADPATIDKVIEDNAKDGWDLTWSTELYNLLGNTSGQEMQWGMYNRFTPEDLETLGAVNTTLTKIKCYPYNHSTAPTQMTGLKVVVYTGGSYEGNTIDPGTLIVDQEYEWDNVFETKTIDLEEPVFIDGTQEIWIGAVYTFTSGYPAVADDGTNYQEKKGDIISMTSNGQTEWSQTKDCLSSGEWPYNWYVFGYIEDGGTPPDPPTPGENEVLVEGFDSGSLPAGWTLVDADGDGYNWQAGSTATGGEPYEGADYFTSASYINDLGPLTPDNWLITPAVAVEGGSIKYYVAAQDAAYAYEHYGVYYSTNGTDPSSFELLFEETMVAKGAGTKVSGENATRNGASKAQGTWYERIIDLTGVSGSEVYFAFRHFDCTDAYFLNLDEVTITTGGETPPTPPAGDALINADFEIGSAGAKVAQTYIEAGYDFFTTFSELPGGAEDPIFTKDQAYEGELAVELTYGNDFIALLGDKTAGHYAIDFQMYVPTGKAGYFNLLHLFNGTSSEWACEIYINSSDNGTAMLIGGETLDFNFPLGQWNAVHFDIDLDNDAASMSINDEVIHEWQFSLNASKGLRQLAALNIYPPEANVSLAYVDNLVYSDLNAGGAIFETDFEDLSEGDYLAASYPEFWDTWSSAPGTAEDAVISKEYAASGSLSSKFVYGSDVVFLAGDKTAGSYTIKFNILVPQGKDGYFNLLHVFAGTSSEHACEIYLNSSTEGTAFKAAGINTSFDFPLGTWNAIQFDIDLDNDHAIFMVNDKVIQEWQFSINASKGLRQLAAVDFFPPTSNAVSLFYMDDFQYIGSGAQTAPVMNVDVTALNFEVEKGDTDSEEVTVSNTGTSIGDYVAWVEYETEAKGGDEHFILSYCGEYNSGVGFTTGTPVIEVASRFPFDYYSTFLGTNINQVSYYCGDYELVNNTLTLRVYGQGTATTPGELLAEKTLSNYQVNYWNTVTFDAPIALDGGDIWVAAEFQQTEGSYPISFDGGTAPYNANGDFYRTNGGGWSNFANAEYGNICIRGFAEGTPVPSWVYLSGETAASLMAGAEESFNVMIDASSIEEGNYNATLVIRTNDENNPLFEIPITLNCTDVDGIVDVEGSFRMYPNPATDVITIEAESTINNIYVYNEIGQLVFNANGNGNVANISVNNLSSGIYFVRIDTANGINVSKLIVK